MKGNQSPYTYIGMIFSTFGCHEKDSDMFSINFNHGDCDKLWYSIKPSGHADLEKLVEEIAPQLVNKCNKHLRHQRLMFPPSLLKKRGIPFTRVGRDSIIFRGTLNIFFFLYSNILSGDPKNWRIYHLDARRISFWIQPWLFQR